VRQMAVAIRRRRIGWPGSLLLLLAIGEMLLRLWPPGHVSKNGSLFRPIEP
jgi:hypothetical protein